jgi:hypothetical protein
MTMAMATTVAGEDAEEAAVAEDTEDLAVEVEDTERKGVADGKVKLSTAEI